MSVNVFVKAIPQVEFSALKPDDRGIPGWHSVFVDSSVEMAHIADAALDVFHSTEAIDVLDNFDFEVWFGGELLEANNDHESYSLSEMGSM